MIHKSYLLEQNIKLLDNNIVLFYGENLGLINDLKKKLIENNKIKILKLTQDEIIKNQNIIFNEINTNSLFEDQKIILIDNVSDKILKIVEEIEPEISKDKIYLFSNLLDKKSKLRFHFEKSKILGIVPCYADNVISIKKIISDKLKGYSGVTQQVTNLLIENSGLDRIKVNNELEKIKIYFIDKAIKFNELDKLTNQKSDSEFEAIKESALKGNKSFTNKLLSSVSLETEKIPFYIASINKRLYKLKELISLSKNKNFTETINSLKPPIFWKDKSNFLDQAKIWDNYKLSRALENTYNLEVNIKSRADIDKTVLLKKLILDICQLACSSK